MSHTAPGVRPAAKPLAPAAADLLPRRRVLVAEENKASRQQLHQWLAPGNGAALDVQGAGCGAEVLQALAAGPYSVVVMDWRLPGLDGRRLLHDVQARPMPPTTLVLTGRGGVAEAVEAMRLGAFDVLTRPVDGRALLDAVRRALAERRWQDEVLYLREHLRRRYAFDELLSKDPAVLGVLDLVRTVGPSDTTVLIEGETGTGKELVARALHRQSPRRERPMVMVNCAAIPEHLLESELFGHEKGAFTSACGLHHGKFELADGDTIFLDEVGDVAPPLQAKLLRFLQEHQFQRVGGTETLRVDVRVAAATNHNLRRLVEEGRFREDLYYRLNVVKVVLPPLRARRDDIPLLATHFAGKYARPGEPARRFSPRALEALADYAWPGNVRELENAVERACVLSRGAVIGLEALPPEVGAAPGARLPVVVSLERPLPEFQRQVIAEIEEQYIRLALEQSRGNVARCAKICGISRRALFDKLAQYKIDKAVFKVRES